MRIPVARLDEFIAEGSYREFDEYRSGNQLEREREKLEKNLGGVKDMLRLPGALFVIDYGFPEREYYHPQRDMGTLMCHYRHRAHGDVFFHPGLQDITAHVDFSAIAAAASEAGLDVLGYASQEQFLVNCGITDLMLRTPPEDAARYLPQAAAATKLLSPAEMGELFKAVAFGRGVQDQLIGFGSGDRRHTL